MLVELKNDKEGRKISIPKQKKRGNKKMIHEIESLMELTPQICQIVRFFRGNGQLIQRS